MQNTWAFSLLMIMTFTTVLGSTAGATTPACSSSENLMRNVRIRHEPGCSSGLVLEMVETICVARSSPVFSQLTPGANYDVCARFQSGPGPGGNQVVLEQVLLLD